MVAVPSSFVTRLWGYVERAPREAKALFSDFVYCQGYRDLRQDRDNQLATK